MFKRVALAVCGAVLLGVSGAQAKIGLGVSAYYGVNIPAAQDDAETGTVFGLRAPVQVINLLRFEPWYGMAQNGDYTLSTPISGETTFEGGEITSFGLNAILGTPLSSPGFSIGFLGGIGSHSYEIQGSESDARVGFNLGLDLGIGLGSMPLSLGARAEAIVIPLESGGSRKNAFITAGLTYKFGL